MPHRAHPLGVVTETSWAPSRQASCEFVCLEGWQPPVDTVQSHHSVEVDDSSPLELGHPAERQHQHLGRFGLADPEYRRQVPVGVDHRPPPQLGRGGVVHDGADVVVALRAQRGAENLVIQHDADDHTASGGHEHNGPARRRDDRHHSNAAVWTAPKPGAVRVRKIGGSLGHRLRNALAALEAGPDQVPGVSSIDGGTGRTAHRAPGAAGLEDDTVGERALEKTLRRSPEPETE